MRSLVWIIVLGMAVISCQDVTIGFLNTENAGYSVDSLEVKIVLDDAVPEIVSNPEYEMYIEMGLSSESCIDMGVYPTIEIGGGEDYTRSKYDIPWTSTSIEGVDGTLPIFATIKEIKSEDGDVEKMRSVLTVNGAGIFSVPCHHEIPAGRYIISLTFTNEGYSKNVEDCFTIIVK